MLQLVNLTPFKAERAVQIDHHGNQVWVVAVKATFRIGGEALPDEMQEAVCEIPKYAGQPGSSSLLREFELVADHPGTEVTILGSAWAPNGRAARVFDVVAQIGPLSKTIRIFGNRYWKATKHRAVPTEPEEFLSVPLRYELAFGGTAWSTVNPPVVESYPYNPIGRGFALRPEALDQQPLPNLEDPRYPITDWTARPMPAGLGPIPTGWMPRKALAGTFDARWMEERMPVWPVDFNRHYYVSAPQELVSSAPFRGGEQVRLINLSRWGDLSFVLPRLHFSFRTEMSSGQVHHRAQLDRVIIEPDELKLVMVWRTVLNCRTDARQIRKTVIDTKRVVA